jgi:hypothetical protein
VLLWLRSFTVLVALATGFFIMTLSQTRSTTRYSDSNRAKFLTDAGVNYVVATPRNDLFQSGEDPSAAWFMTNYLRGARGPFLTQLNLSVRRASRCLRQFAWKHGWNRERPLHFGNRRRRQKISANAGDNLAVILDNLSQAILAPLISADTGYLQPRRRAAEDADAATYAPPYVAAVPGQTAAPGKAVVPFHKQLRVHLS